MNLTETPEIVTWKETHYVFVEKQGPFMNNAPQAWGEAHAQLEALTKHNRITGYLSLYKVHTQIYRAGFALDAPPVELPGGLSYELFAGGKYSRFVLTGPYTLLPQATGRVFEIVLERGIEQRDDYCIEHYLNDPRMTPVEELQTEILIPTV
jgi:hypothetical protein